MGAALVQLENHGAGLWHALMLASGLWEQHFGVPLPSFGSLVFKHLLESKQKNKVD